MHHIRTKLPSSEITFFVQRMFGKPRYKCELKSMQVHSSDISNLFVLTKMTHVSVSFLKFRLPLPWPLKFIKKKSVEYENPPYLKDHQSVPIISYAAKYAYCNSTNIRYRISTLMTSKPPDCNCASSTFISNPHATTGDVTLTLSTALLYEMC